MATWTTLWRDTLWTQLATNRNLVQGWSQAQLVPSNCARMCTLTNEDIIALRFITTKALNTNNVFIFAFGVLGHGFLGHRCNVRWHTHIRTKGSGLIIHPLHELSLRARGTQVQISQQPLQICDNALPIPAQTTACLGGQTIHFTFPSERTMPHSRLRCSSARGGDYNRS